MSGESAGDIPLADLLPAVVGLAEDASRAVMAVYESAEVSVDYKADHSPVTNADKVADQIIINGLGSLTPTIPVVSEESLEHVGQITPAMTYWLVDPIDGTKEFLQHNGEFTVNIGLVRAGVPVLGVVAAPALQLLYYGSAETGAFKRSQDGRPVQLHTPGRKDPVIAAVSRSHLDDATKAWLQAHHITRTVAVGSSLKICYVADGTVDVMARLGSQHEWDIAAADAVLRAAGGGLVDAGTGKPLVYGHPESHTTPYIAQVSVSSASEK